MQAIERLLLKARPNIQKLVPYASARLHASAQSLKQSTLLNANENPYAPPLVQLPADLERNRYPEPQPQGLLDALAQLYAVPSDMLLVGRGSDEGIDLLIRAFCAEKDAILICSPSFGMYQSYANIQGCRVMDLPLVINSAPSLDGASLGGGYSGGGSKQLYASLPMQDLRKLFQQESLPKLIFLPNPLAPLGCLLAEGELEELLALCAERDVLLVIDEAYAEFASELTAYQSCIKLLPQNPQLVVLRTLSKAFSLAGERIGSLIAAPKLIHLLRPLQAPYPIPTSISQLVQSILSSKESCAVVKKRIQELCREQQRLFAGLEALACVRYIFRSAANFAFICSDRTQGVLDCAAKEGIVLRDFRGSWPDMADSLAMPNRANRPSMSGSLGGLRVSVGSPEQNTRLLEVLGKC